MRSRQATVTQYDFVGEPRGEVLDHLISAAIDACDRFTVELSGMLLDDRAMQVLRAFEPFLMSCVETSETPGSILAPGDTIKLCTYRLNAASAAVIRASARRLYDWVEPSLPQCLCFLRGSEPWLINLAADAEGCLLLSPEEAAAVRAAVPGLRIRQPRSRDISER